MARNNYGRGKGIILVAVLIALIISLLTYYWMSPGNSREVIQKQPVIPMVKVVVALDNLPAHTQIAADKLSVKEVPQDTVNPDAAQTLEDVEGAFVRADIFKGEQILKSRVFSKTEGMGLSVNIPEGKRALTIIVDEMKGVAGFIKPKDYIDVLATFNDPKVEGGTVTFLLAQNIYVLAVGQEMVAKKEENNIQGRTVTLAVNPEEAAQIAFAEDRAKLRLVLRPFVENVGTSEVAGVTSDKILKTKVKVKLIEPITTTPSQQKNTDVLDKMNQVVTNTQKLATQTQSLKIPDEYYVPQSAKIDQSRPDLVAPPTIPAPATKSVEVINGGKKETVQVN